LLLPDNFLDPAGEDAPFQQDAPAALKAFYPDIRTHPYHLPFVAAAGMRLSEFYRLAEADFPLHYSTAVTPDFVDSC